MVIPGASRCLSARVLAAVTAGALALGLAACSTGSSAGEITTAPAVSANGKHYVYAPGSVAESAWPKVCSLLTTKSAAAAIGTAVTTKAFHHRCYYIPDNDAFPTLTVTILGIGNDQQDAFDNVRDQNSRFAPVKVTGVGERAVTYTLPNSPTVNLDMLARQGLFEVALRSPVGNELDPAQVQSILGRVGRTLAAEFSG